MSHMSHVIENFSSRRARGWRVPWVVYRDGERWSVSAADMHEALDLARRVPRNIGEAAILSGKKAELYVRVDTSVEPSAAPWDAKSSLICLQARGHEVDCVFSPTPGILFVCSPLLDLDPRHFPAWANALGVVEHNAARLQVAKGVAVRHIAVQLYRSGPREGLPRFSRDHDETYRAQVLDAIEHNAERLRAIETEETCVVKTLECLPVLGPRVYTDVDALELQALEKLEGQLARIWETGFVHKASEGVHDWWSDADYGTERALANARSVRDHGYCVGARCLLADSGHEDQPHGPGVVLKVSVSEESVRCGPDRLLHDRLVHLDGGGEWWTNVDNLSPEPAR